MTPRFHIHASAIHAFAIAACTFIAGAAIAQTADSQDCNALPPPIAQPDVKTFGPEPETLPRESLSDRLATCGSVLDPPSIGDTEADRPPPSIDDPLTIHPGDPSGTMK